LPTARPTAPQERMEASRKDETPFKVSRRRVRELPFLLMRPSADVLYCVRARDDRRCDPLHTPASAPQVAAERIGGMGVLGTHPPQNRRTNLFNGLPVTTATAARSAASIRRIKHFNGLWVTAANHRDGLFRADDPGSHVAFTTIILVDDLGWSLSEERLHGVLEIGGLEASTLAFWPLSEQAGSIIAGFTV
jgi:hypothetical protein